MLIVGGGEGLKAGGREAGGREAERQRGREAERHKGRKAERQKGDKATSPIRPISLICPIKTFELWIIHL